MANTALCIRCGSFKKSHTAACPSCSFLPASDVEIAKSRILDYPYSFARGACGEVVETGRTLTELQVIAEQIKSGKPYSFPEKELASVLEVWRQAKQTTPRQLWLALAKWLAPPLALAVAVAYLLWKSAA